MSLQSEMRRWVRIDNHKTLRRWMRHRYRRDVRFVDGEWFDVEVSERSIIVTLPGGDIHYPVDCIASYVMMLMGDDEEEMMHDSVGIWLGVEGDDW